MWGFLAFMVWFSHSSRGDARRGDGASAFMILLILLPVIVTLLAPYLLWCAFRDRGNGRLVAGTASVAMVLVAVYGLLEGLWWQTMVVAMVVGAWSLGTVFWVAYKRERAASEKEHDESVPRWRFS